MRLTILTYNTLYGRAVNRVIPFIKEKKPDIFCLQELEINQESFKSLHIDHYKLANFSNSFIKFGRVFGIATFYNSQRVKVSKTETFNIPRSIWETLLVIFKGGNKPRTSLITEFIIDKKRGCRVLVCNIHFSAMASAGLKLRQMKKVLREMFSKGEEKIIITGDFNFPYERKRFENIFKKYGLKEATDNIFFSLTNKILNFLSLKLKTDYILYKGIKKIKTEKINVRFSDHYPIMAEFEIKDAV